MKGAGSGCRDGLPRERYEEKFCVVDLVICAVGYGILRGSRLFRSRRMVCLARWDRAVGGNSYHLFAAKAQMNIGVFHKQFDRARRRYVTSLPVLNAPQGK